MAPFKGRSLSKEKTGIEKKRFTEQQILGLCRKHGFSDATFYGWRSKFGGLRVSEAKRLRELEAENGKLKKLLAEAHLDVEARRSPSR